MSNGLKEIMLSIIQNYLSATKYVPEKKFKLIKSNSLHEEIQLSEY